MLFELHRLDKNLTKACTCVRTQTEKIYFVYLKCILKIDKNKGEGKWQSQKSSEEKNQSQAGKEFQAGVEVEKTPKST